jgi:hypothetical protein
VQPVFWLQADADLEHIPHERSRFNAARSAWTRRVNQEQTDPPHSESLPTGVFDTAAVRSQHKRREADSTARAQASDDAAVQQAERELKPIGRPGRRGAR